MLPTNSTRSVQISLFDGYYVLIISRPIETNSAVFRLKGSPQVADFATVAIDGPAASGKTTVGKLVASRLGAQFLDTGLMYRAVAVAALDRGVDYRDEDALAKMIADVDMTFTLRCADLRVEIEGNETTSRLRQADVEEAVSPVAKSPAVRHAMVARQRSIAAEGPTVVAGRDIGTVVLPDANVKVYLDAAPEVRAQRRRRELEGEQDAAGLERVMQRIRGRDLIDSRREMSPLKPASDAVRIDTDGLEVEEVASAVLELVTAR